MIIVIVGPTAVGKTKLSVELAKRLNAEIINGDSTQVYRDLDIGTAKVREEEKEGIVHHLFDIVDVSDFYTVFDYQKDCRRLIEEITSRGKNVIIVGGTGLYMKAALYDYRFTEGTSYQEYSDLSNEEIYERIKKYQDCDVHIHNRKRLVRLLNKLESGEELTNYKDHKLYNFSVIGLTTARERLYQRIDERVYGMMRDGLLEEVEGLREQFATSKALQTAIGYKEFIEYFSNKKRVEDVITEIQKNSRHYAKRQYTFFNHQFDTKWYDVDFDNFSNTVDLIYQELLQEN